VTKTRCAWAGNDPLMTKYHDEEWGTPQHDDRKLFEYMVLDAFQAGLSWSIILNKRNGFDKAFVHFEPHGIAKFGEADINRLMQDSGIVRNRLKIAATIANSKLVLGIQQEFGSLDSYLWNMVGGKPLVSRNLLDGNIAATSAISDNMSRSLRARGFKFYGSTVCYAFMQGAGLVNDHIVTCFRYNELLSDDLGR
jgi:DNA-3-methyladenine glycosylase I